MKTRHKSAPRNRCTVIEEAWGPHPGCAEFMDGPDAVWQCTGPATHTVKDISPYDGPQRDRECARHARISATYGARVYRFRRNPNGAKAPAASP